MLLCYFGFFSFVICFLFSAPRFSKSAFAPFDPVHGRIPSAASIQAGFPKYSSSDLLEDLQQNSTIDLQFHGFLMSNVSPVPINDGAFSMELSKNGYAPWSWTKSEFICKDQYSLDECFNTNVTFRRDFHDVGQNEWTATHLTSLLVPAWLCLTVCNSQATELPRCYFKYSGNCESSEINEMWTRYGFLFRYMFGEGTEQFSKNSFFKLLCDQNFQSTGYRVYGTFDRNIRLDNIRITSL